jgi:Diguanylate cyclase, GGDEF domain
MAHMQYPIDEDPRDEGRLADLTSAGMWTTAGLVGSAMFLLPGSPHEHLGIGLGIAGFAVLWGAISLVLYLTRSTMSIGVRALVTAGTAPIVTAAIWASGGASSFLGPLLLFTSLFIAYFFPPRLAWPLVALYAFVFATPLLYDPAAVDVAFAARALGFGVAIAGETFVMQLLKRRLLRAEARQRVMAERDPLTALYNRRSFDAALANALRGLDGTALVLFDFDDFKAINDEYGASFAWAVAPADARTGADLLECADQRLLYRKRLNKV